MKAATLIALAPALQAACRAAASADHSGRLAWAGRVEALLRLLRLRSYSRSLGLMSVVAMKPAPRHHLKS